ncbi:MAG: hypothetical protein JOY93_01745 [Acidobacteriales bacterium]|nr:hypothetical protein [Terriglobales bacterium]
MAASQIVFCMNVSGQRSPAGRNVATTQAKLQRLGKNGEAARPDSRPVTFTEQEINDYFAYGGVKLPPGVESVRFSGENGVVSAALRVDFDRLKSGRNSSNPLLSVFTGVHDLGLVSHARGAGGQGFVDVDSASLDGVELPRMLLQLFVDKYLRPRYPDLGLNSRFALPDRIDSAVVGRHTITFTQK